MMHLPCEHCGKEGSLEDLAYSGKRLRLKCPYCSSDFVFRVPFNGNGAAAVPGTAFSPEREPVPVGAAIGPAVPGMVVMAPSAQTTAPPVEAAPAGVAEAPPQVDEAVVSEAKRIARLIISEIKLYNQEKIAKSRNKREVLELLKNDLIKGKQHYNTRIASKLPIGPDYFMETVKEILLAGKN